MNPNVLIGVTVIFVLLVAACGVWMNASSNAVDKSVDHAVELTCYDYGRDGAYGETKVAPYTDEHCADVYEDAYRDGSRQLRSAAGGTVASSADTPDVPGLRVVQITRTRAKMLISWARVGGRRILTS